MIRRAFAILLLVFALPAAAGTPLERIEQAVAMIDREDYAGARDLLDELASKPDALQPQERYLVESLLASAL
ncbi:MAG: hypothetical protein JOZ72_02930, partial [Alphaproteobacteria bacterium]|nr:hypothetical protein [Alphaproteobacteria bacterium]